MAAGGNRGIPVERDHPLPEVSRLPLPWFLLVAGFWW